ncbi:MAG: alpha/beta fold hydrolase [Cyclobacteriaceae bacterium]
MKLNFRVLGEGDPMFILHGVFGSSDNWQTVGKELAQYHKVYLIDQRNHGSSDHSDEMNYEVMAEDIKALMEAENLSSINLLGHSMGGKVAMTFATNYPDLVKKLIIVDITPREYPPHHSQIFEGFHSINLEQLQTRKDADEQMATVIPNFGVRQFILKNLTRVGGQFAWKINLGVIEKNISEIGRPLPSESLFPGETLFIGGAKSDYIQASDHSLIKTHFPNSQVKMIEGAGHWVHAEKPQELQKLVIEFLSTSN